VAVTKLGCCESPRNIAIQKVSRGEATPPFFVACQFAILLSLSWESLSNFHRWMAREVLCSSAILTRREADLSAASVFHFFLTRLPALVEIGAPIDSTIPARQCSFLPLQSRITYAPFHTQHGWPKEGSTTSAYLMYLSNRNGR
jgi:hypothetical protein